MSPKVFLLYILFGLGEICYGRSVSAAIISYVRDGNRVKFTLDKGSLELDIHAADLVEVRYSSLPAIPVRKSLVFIQPWKGVTSFQVKDAGDYVVITTDRLIIRIDKADLAIQYLSKAGKIILAEDGSAGKRMTPSIVTGFHTYTCRTQFVSPAGEALYGLGCHPLDSGSINYKGRRQDMAIRYMTGAIPVLLSTRGYGLLWDNYAASRFNGEVKQDTRFRYTSESGNLIDYYFFYGPKFDHIIASYRKATGEAPMFPKWAFGLFQSQDRYQSQAEVLAVKDNYRKNHIPLDAIVQDWFYWAPFPIGSHIMNPQNYPNPKAMVEELHRAHVHAMISIWPCFGAGSRDYKALEQIHGFTDIRWNNIMSHNLDVYYDPYNPRARALYWKQAGDSLMIRDGWDGWWADQCEPDDGDSLDVRRQNEFYLGRGIDYFNTYSLEHTTAIYQGWRRDIPGKRVFILARQAFAGQQRNAATLWSSDVTSTFSSLKDQVSQGINACVSGIPYWTSDIGGYHYHGAAPDWSTPANRELFIRWFQFGSFCPIFRIHGKGERALYSDHWDSLTKAILLSYDNLRYRLMPYIYSLGWKVTQEGYTPMRALAFDFRKDTAVYNIRNQYMFGPDFLVCPVDRKGLVIRSVYLPEGSRWFDFWTGKSLKGGETIQSPAPLETMPLFVKAGSILPMGPYLQYATEKPADPLELRIYPGANAHFTLYEDANNGYGYRKGQYSTIRFTWDDQRHILSIGKQEGKYPGMKKTRFIHVVLVRMGHGISIAPENTPDQIVKYEGAPLQLKLN